MPVEQLPLLTEAAFQRRVDHVLFDHASVPFVKHSKTSKQAAKAFGEKAVSLEKRILEWLRARGERGATDAEIWAAFPEAKEGTCRARRVGLRDKLLVVDSGETRHQCVVWIAQEAAPLAGAGLEAEG